MSDIKLTKEELEELIQTGEDKKNILIKLGQNTVQTTSLKTQYNQLVRLHDEISVKQNTIAKNLEEKYGKGTVDITTGTFIPF